MSGGHFDYKCYRIIDFAYELNEEILNNGKKGNDRGEEFDDGYSDFNDKTIGLLKRSQQIIELAGKLSKEIEYLYSGDHGEETFEELYTEILINSPIQTYNTLVSDYFKIFDHNYVI